MILIWAVIAVVTGFVIIFIAGIIMTFFNNNLQDFSNIPDLELIFSIPSMVIIITIQPVCEEIFYRGFLLDKISSLTSEKIAIVITGILFGTAHLIYANIYPAILTSILGMIFAYVVIKTKSLTTGIIAHIAYNIISIALYLFARSVLFQSLIL
jgi:membrane protease YdiL (CAAX protease family)